MNSILVCPSFRAIATRAFFTAALGLAFCSNARQLVAQSVCLPLPRLLLVQPMGGTAGTTFDATVTGENLDDVGELMFQHPGVTAVRKRDAQGQPMAREFTITIAPDVPAGLIEARITSRLGISSARIFSIGTYPETMRSQPNVTLATAMPIAINSVCNAWVSPKAIDHFGFDATAGHRYIIQCDARGIDSKLDPVLIVADANGQDKVVERRGDVLDFRPTVDGRYIIKVHDLTYRGGSEYFYRLHVREIGLEDPVPTFPATQSVSAFSWPPTGLPATAASLEEESAEVQTLAVPCDVQGRFFPAADVDTYQFAAQAGETWWIEVASERLGRPTDPAIVVQAERGEGPAKSWVDLAELNDIASPMKPSSNGYAYDGPPFDGGSTDILGKLEIKETGNYRILLSDAFGGTRRDPRNRYRLIVRRALPDFAVVAWGLHMELRNGDRNALSKPLALRAGSTVALEVVTVRRDGFDGEIQLSMTGLPEGVTASDLKIAAGKSRGIVLLTAREDASPDIRAASLNAQAVINDQTITHPVRVAQMAWPIVDAWNEIPYPRLVDGIPVSVTQSELAPVTIAPAEPKAWEMRLGQVHKIPLRVTRRSEFSGAIVSMRTWGHGLEGNPPFDVSLTADASEAVLNLMSLQPPPGDYRIAFYGSAVAKYRYYPAAVELAAAAHAKAQEELQRLNESLQQAMQAAASAAAESKSAADQRVAELTSRKQTAEAAVAAAAAKLKSVTEQSAPRDTAEMVVSEPVTIRILPKDPS
ncbi:MAG: serine protease [Pirellula sp.]